MQDKPSKVEMEEEFTICPSCGYGDNFHSVFKREDGMIKWHFIFPSCHEPCDLGFTTAQAGQG